MTLLQDIERGLAQLFWGALFGVVGLVLTAIAVGPALLSLRSPAPHADVALPLLGVGVGLMVFGAACTPSLLPVVLAALRGIVDQALRLIQSRTPPPKDGAP